MFLDGHALSKKLAKQVKKCDCKLKEMLIQYNSSCDLLSDENKRSFKNMQIGNLFNAVEGLMSWPENEMNAAARKPYSIQRQAVDMLHLQRWSKEEMLLIE